MSGAKSWAVRGLAALGGALLLAIATVLTVYGVAVQKENDDAFCASCHTKPETTYYQNSLTNRERDLAAWHRGEETRCIDCHSGPGVRGRLVAMGNGLLDLLAYRSGNYRDPAVTMRPVDDAGCTKYHDMPKVFAGEAGEGRSVTGVEGYDGHYHAELLLLRWRVAGGLGRGRRLRRDRREAPPAVRLPEDTRARLCRAPVPLTEEL